MFQLKKIILFLNWKLLYSSSKEVEYQISACDLTYQGVSDKCGDFTPWTAHSVSQIARYLDW